MEIFNEIFSNPVISTLFAVTLTGMIGLLIGDIKIRGIKIGITGALFSGIVLSYAGIKYNDEIVHFLREFGLVIFVYAVGIQVGSGFFSSFRKNGLILNISAIIVVIINVLMVLFLKFFLKFEPLTSIGLYCGAVTNTPALASAQGAVTSINQSIDISQISSSYAIAYPGAIFAIITAMIILKNIFPQQMQIQSSSQIKNDITNRTLVVENPNLNNIKICDIPALDELNIIITRIKKNKDTMVALPDTVVNTGDRILAVGRKNNLDEFEKIVGKKSDEDLIKETQRILNTRVVVTNKNLIGKKIQETKIPSYGVVVTRVSRSDVEFLISDDYEINFADQLVIVGEEENVKMASSYIGNSPKELNHTDLVSIFIGIITGIIIGSFRFSLPFAGKSLNLGLAGGLLVSAIIFSNIRNIGRISWYIPPAANIIIRELGIVIFLSCVGLKSGANFFSMISSYTGVKIVLSGFFISFLAVFVVGFILLKFYKQNCLTVFGLMSGSMTDPPALAWAQTFSDSNLVSMAYASVYPLTMFLRIITAQILVFIFYG